MQRYILLCILNKSNISDEYISTLVTMHGLRAEDRVHERPAGAQPDPTWRHLPEGGAGGEQEDLSEKSCATGGSGGVAAGESHLETNQVWNVWL